MKKLMIASFLLLGGCVVSLDLDTPKDGPYSSFPAKWQGYYTKISGNYDLPKEFKVSRKYMSYKDKYYQDSDDILVYQIDGDTTESSASISFFVESAYDSDRGNDLYYSFKEELDGSIKVQQYGYSTFFPDTYTGTYEKRSL